jgi:hypothetical protein
MGYLHRDPPPPIILQTLSQHNFPLCSSVAPELVCTQPTWLPLYYYFHFKGECQQIFDFRFFSESVSPKLLSFFTISAISKFFEAQGANTVFHRYEQHQRERWQNLPAVSSIPVANLLPVSLTPLTNLPLVLLIPVVHLDLRISPRI